MDELNPEKKIIEKEVKAGRESKAKRGHEGGS